MKTTFLFNFIRLTEEVETLGKNSEASSHTAISREDIREARTILACCFTDSRSKVF